jgi:hypothetical protein
LIDLVFSISLRNRDIALSWNTPYLSPAFFSSSLAFFSSSPALFASSSVFSASSSASLASSSAFLAASSSFSASSSAFFASPARSFASRASFFASATDFFASATSLGSEIAVPCSSATGVSSEAHFSFFNSNFRQRTSRFNPLKSSPARDASSETLFKFFNSYFTERISRFDEPTPLSISLDTELDPASFASSAGFFASSIDFVISSASDANDPTSFGSEIQLIVLQLLLFHLKLISASSVRV